uniref:Uncharacterized protein n=1 Tax=Arundo donax TaxID=35708 RepID=A0A0A9HCK9_ARUDO
MNQNLLLLPRERFDRVAMFQCF